MELFSSLFNKKSSENKPTVALGYTTELHNHLLPSIDDGVGSIEESLQAIGSLASLGIKKIITTPHIKADIYNNTQEIIGTKLAELQSAVKKNNLEVTIEAAAEYYLDESFMRQVKGGKKLLSFGANYILFETSHVDESHFFIETVFELRMQGYKPIFAHPERYHYGFNNFSILERIYDTGVFFQLNINSLQGYYGKDQQKQAKILIEKGMVDFVGTDAHGMRHINILEKSIATKEYQKLMASGKIMNDKL